MKNTMTAQNNLWARKALPLVMVTLSDSFRIWPPSRILRHFGATFKKTQNNLHFPIIV